MSASACHNSSKYVTAQKWGQRWAHRLFFARLSVQHQARDLRASHHFTKETMPTAYSSCPGWMVCEI